MNEEDRIKSCSISVFTIKSDCRCTDKIISLNIYGLVLAMFFLLPSISMWPMLMHSRVAWFPCLMTQSDFTPSVMQGSKQAMAWHQLAQQICFAVSSLEETCVKGVNLANCSGGKVQKTLLFKGSKMKFHPTPWMPRWAGRLVVLTQAKQLGKCQEPFFWEQEVHLVKAAGLFYVL